MSLCVLVTQSYLTLCDPLDGIAHQAHLSMEFSRQEYWNGLPFLSPGDLPNLGIELALQADSLSSEPLGKSSDGSGLENGWQARLHCGDVI